MPALSNTPLLPHASFFIPFLLRAASLSTNAPHGPHAAWQMQRATNLAFERAAASKFNFHCWRRARAPVSANWSKQAASKGTAFTLARLHYRTPAPKQRSHRHVLAACCRAHAILTSKTQGGMRDSRTTTANKCLSAHSCTSGC